MLSVLRVRKDLTIRLRQCTYRVHVRTLWLGPARLSLPMVLAVLKHLLGPPPSMVLVYRS